MDRRALLTVAMFVGGCGTIVRAQDSPPGASSIERDLTTRYRFVERYGSQPAEAVMTEYEVGYRETIQVSTENAQGAPRVEEVVRAARYAERVASVNPIDEQAVQALVRRYESASVTPDPWAEIGAPALMSGMDLLIENPVSVNPTLTVLTPDRRLWDHEYRFAAGTPFTPGLSNILPVGPLRLGESWVLTQVAAAALLGEPVESGSIQGKLSEIRPIVEPKADGATEIAILDLEGRIRTRMGPTSVRSRLEFAFRLIAPQPAAGGRANAAQTRDEALIGAGALTSLRHVQVTTVPTIANGPPGFEQRRELILQRRWPVPEGRPLSVPNPPPAPTPENSWLVYADPLGRFHFRHPQTFRIDPRAPGAAGDQVTLVQFRRETPDLLVISYREGVQPKPDEAFQGAIERYKAAGFEVLPLDPKQLPAAEWPGMAVYRIEAALTPPAQAVGASRTHVDGYLMLPGQPGAIQAMALTNSPDEIQAFRALAESVLQTLKLGRP